MSEKRTVYTVRQVFLLSSVTISNTERPPKPCRALTLGCSIPD